MAMMMGVLNKMALLIEVEDHVVGGITVFTFPTRDRSIPMKDLLHWVAVLHLDAWLLQPPVAVSPAELITLNKTSGVFDGGHMPHAFGRSTGTAD